MSELLTIAYPAYKRPELLAGSIDSLVECGLAGKVKVLICDDSLSNANERVAEEARTQGFDVRYIANPLNLGIDANIKQCFDECDTDYCWVIGEDDRVVEEGAADVLRQICTEPKGIYFVNYVYCSDDYQRILSAPLLRDFDSLDTRSVLASFHLFGFIGASIISTKLWRSISPEVRVGTYFHHLSVLGRAIFEHRVESYFVASVCVLNRSEGATSTSWVERSLDVHFGYYEALSYFERYLSEEERKLLLQSSRELFRPHNLSWLVSKRADGALRARDVGRWYGDQSIVRRCAIMLIALTPVRLARLLKLCYLLWKRVRARVA